ncbi:hypothetical protein [Cohnella mopanensis]|uniref:hypothetical protein n=1 Tax=Cohnella mopanensis TaxID=2911966 RepID=UPI001EF8A862|nr:hypothetical protein [Cohnella mopanensis]
MTKIKAKFMRLSMVCVLLLGAVTGCGGKEEAGKEKGKEAIASESAIPELQSTPQARPSGFPEDLPIPADAENLIYTENSAAAPGDMAYSVSYHTKTDVEQSIAPYRTFMKEKGYEFKEQDPIDGGITATGKTATWEFRLTVLIDHLNEGHINVEILYVQPSS